MLDLTPADLLARGLHLPPIDEQPVALPVGTSCAITGQPIRSGYPVAAMVTTATAEFLDCFRGGINGYISEHAARCFRSANPRLGNPTARSILAFGDGTLWQPLIARTPAKEQGRPCWSDLVRAVWPERAHQLCLVILTTDTKKRLWIRARVGTLGSQTPLYYHDAPTGLSQVLLLDWPALLDCLALVEHVYTLGFVKAAIRVSLLSQFNLVRSVGLAASASYERQLQAWRSRPELLPAVLIAQKPEEEIDDQPDAREGDHSAQLALL